MAGKYRLTTLGCKVNQYESQQIRELLESLNLQPADAHETPNLAVVNTCAVTASALRKSRQAIRRSAREGAPVIVVGCGVSLDPHGLRSLGGVVAALGHGTDICAELRTMLTAWLGQTVVPSLADATPWVGAAREPLGANEDDVWMKPLTAGRTGRPKAPQATKPPTDNILHDSPAVVNIVKPLTGRIQRFAAHQRAFLKVQDGCDAGCTYCVIPRLRPVLRSKPIGMIVEEARGLIRAGHREIIITGVFLGAYGRDTAVRKRFDRHPSPLAEMVSALARNVPGLERLRLSSLEPGDVDEALLEVLSTYPQCVPHLHLPLQSGSERILRRMNRQYTRAAFIAMIDRVRAALDRPAITTDIMVGFPGETDEDFAASLETARFAQFAKIHAFPFSPRPSTAASRWRTDFVAGGVVRERMRQLAAVERECSLAYRRRALGSIERVLVETESHDGSDGPHRGHLCSGRSDRYFEVEFEAPENVRCGDIVHVRVEEVTPTQTYGTHISPVVEANNSGR